MAAEKLLETYNPLYDVHLQQYFALPHMQKHLKSIGLLDADEGKGEVYARHKQMIDIMLKNRETQLLKLAELQKKFDAAEKVEIYRRIRSGQSPESYRRSAKPSRSLSRGRRCASQSTRTRRYSNSAQDKDIINKIEQENKEEIKYSPTNCYQRLSATSAKYRYLHKLDDPTLQTYKDQLRRQLEKLERFREVSFGVHSVARHQPPASQSWFFRRRSLPSLTASAPAHTLQEPLRSINQMRGRKTAPADRPLGESYSSRVSCPPAIRKRRSSESNPRLPQIQGQRAALKTSPATNKNALPRLPPAHPNKKGSGTTRGRAGRPSGGPVRVSKSPEAQRNGGISLPSLVTGGVAAAAAVAAGASAAAIVSAADGEAEELPKDIIDAVKDSEEVAEQQEIEVPVETLEEEAVPEGGDTGETADIVGGLPEEAVENSKNDYAEEEKDAVKVLDDAEIERDTTSSRGEEDFEVSLKEVASISATEEKGFKQDEAQPMHQEDGVERVQARTPQEEEEDKNEESGPERVQAQTPQDDEIHNRLQAENLQEERRLEQVDAKTPQEGEGLERVQAQTLQEEEEGLGRVQAQAPQAEEGLERVQAQTPQEEEGLERVQAQTPHAEEGLERVQAQTPQKEEGLERIQAQTPQEEEGLERLQSQTPQEEEGLEQVKAQTPQYEEGLERVQAQTPQEEEGFERVQAQNMQEEEGLERVQAQTPQEEEGLERVQAQTPQEGEGLESVQAQTPQEEEGFQRVQAQNMQEEEGLERVQAQTPQEEERLERVQAQTPQEEEGFQRFQAQTPQETEGLERVQNQTPQNEQFSERVPAQSSQEEERLERVHVETPRQEEELQKFEKNTPSQDGANMEESFERVKVTPLQAEDGAERDGDTAKQTLERVENQTPNEEEEEQGRGYESDDEMAVRTTRESGAPPEIVETLVEGNQHQSVHMEENHEENIEQDLMTMSVYESSQPAQESEENTEVTAEIEARNELKRENDEADALAEHVAKRITDAEPQADEFTTDENEIHGSTDELEREFQMVREENTASVLLQETLRDVSSGLENLAKEPVIEDLMSNVDDNQKDAQELYVSGADLLGEDRETSLKADSTKDLASNEDFSQDEKRSQELGSFSECQDFSEPLNEFELLSQKSEELLGNQELNPMKQEEAAFKATHELNRKAVAEDVMESARDEETAFEPSHELLRDQEETQSARNSLANSEQLMTVTRNDEEVLSQEGTVEQGMAQDQTELPVGGLEDYQAPPTAHEDRGDAETLEQSANAENELESKIEEEAFESRHEIPLGQEVESRAEVKTPSDRADSPHATGLTELIDSPRATRSPEEKDSTRTAESPQPNDDLRAAGSSQLNDNPDVTGSPQKEDSPRAATGSPQLNDSSPVVGSPQLDDYLRVAGSQDSPRAAESPPLDDKVQVAESPRREDSPKAAGFFELNDSPRAAGSPQKEDSPLAAVGSPQLNESPRAAVSPQLHDNLRADGSPQREDSPLVSAGSPQSNDSPMATPQIDANLRLARSLLQDESIRANYEDRMETSSKKSDSGTENPHDSTYRDEDRSQSPMSEGSDAGAADVTVTSEDDNRHKLMSPPESLSRVAAALQSDVEPQNQDAITHNAEV